MAQWSPASHAQPGLVPHAQPHPQLGGKGLPPQVSAPAYHPHHPSSPAPSSPASSSRYGTLGPPPDLTERFRVKHKYLGYQRRWHKGLELRKDLELELAEKEAKVQALQDEVDLILDQIHDSDYAHLVPARDDLFSDDDGEEDLDDDDGAAARDEDGDDEAGEPHVKDEEDDEGEAAAASRSRKGKKRSLEDEEAQRRTEIEARYGIDGSRQIVTRADPAPEPEPAPAPAPAAAPAPSAADGPAPKRLKLTFGNGAGGDWTDENDRRRRLEVINTEWTRTLIRIKELEWTQLIREDPQQARRAVATAVTKDQNTIAEFQLELVGAERLVQELQVEVETANAALEPYTSSSRRRMAPSALDAWTVWARQLAANEAPPDYGERPPSVPAGEHAPPYAQLYPHGRPADAFSPRARGEY